MVKKSKEIEELKVKVKELNEKIENIKESKKTYESFNILLLSYSIVFSAFIAFVSLLFSSKIYLEFWLNTLIYFSFLFGIWGLFAIASEVMDYLKKRKIKILLSIGLLFLIITPLIIIIFFSFYPPYSARLYFGASCPIYLNKNSQNEIGITIGNTGEMDGWYSISLVGDNVTFKEKEILYKDFQQSLTIYRVIGPIKDSSSEYFNIFLGNNASASFIVYANCTSQNCYFMTTKAYQCFYEQKEGFYTQIHLINVIPL